MVTVEAAFATLSLGVVVALLMSVFVLLAAQLRVNDAARVAARSAALGGDDAESLASRAAPGSSIAIDRNGAVLVVEVTQTVAFPVPGLAPVVVTGRAHVLDELSALDLGGGW